MSVAGDYKITMNTPMGPMSATLTFKEDAGQISGKMSGDLGENDFSNCTLEGNTAKFNLDISAMGQQVSLACEAVFDGDNIKGTMSSPMGGADFSGQRAS